MLKSNCSSHIIQYVFGLSFRCSVHRIYDDGGEIVFFLCFDMPLMTTLLRIGIVRYSMEPLQSHSSYPNIRHAYSVYSHKDHDSVARIKLIRFCALLLFHSSADSDLYTYSMYGL